MTRSWRSEQFPALPENMPGTEGSLCSASGRAVPCVMHVIDASSVVQPLPLVNSLMKYERQRMLTCRFIVRPLPVTRRHKSTPKFCANLLCNPSYSRASMKNTVKQLLIAEITRVARSHGHDVDVTNCVNPAFPRKHRSR